jgi:hypothetical protein
MSHDPTLPHQVESFPEFDEFSPKDHGGAERYRRVRQAFLPHLLKLPTVKALFARWNRQTGLGKLAADVARTSDHLAKTLKLPNRVSLNQRASVTNVEALPAQTRRLVTQREAACALFAQCLRSLAQTIGPEARRIVEVWGMPWFWVEQGLIHAFILKHGAIAIGVPGFNVTLQIPPERVRMTATMDFANKAELEVLLDRIRQEGRAALTQPKATTTTTRLKSRKPKKPKTQGEPDHLDLYAEWFVRHRIGGVEITQLAKEFHERYHQRPLGPLDCRNDYSTVSKGIDRAQEVLNLTAHTRLHTPPDRN